jgi:hypothetical protein
MILILLVLAQRALMVYVTDVERAYIKHDDLAYFKVMLLQLFHC